jgi:hypothetical protein
MFAADRAWTSVEPRGSRFSAIILARRGPSLASSFTTSQPFVARIGVSMFLASSRE